jgi:predicted aldo/keto reductase-like oxidoreductase
VNIPINFKFYNQAKVFKGSSVVLCRNLYKSLPEVERTSACLECRTCEEKCPQHIPISETLGAVQEQFK